MPVRMSLASARTPGAVAIVQLHGAGIIAVLRSLTGDDRFPLASLRYVPFADIDHGLAVRLRDDWAQLMPHGGPRVVQKLIDWLLAHG